MARSERRQLAGEPLYADREIGAPGNANLLIGRSQGTKPPSFPKKDRKANTRIYNA